jgi:CheY-like chemotaxis protein
MAQFAPIVEPAILVVEDELFIRMHLVDAIESEGFRVYEAANADEAIATREVHPDIRVLFPDIDMPGTMDGVKLSHYVRYRWPPVRIFVASGRTCPLRRICL